MGRLYTAFKSLCREGFLAIYHDFIGGRVCQCIDDIVCSREKVVPMLHAVSGTANGQLHKLGSGGGYDVFAGFMVSGPNSAVPYILIYGEDEALTYVPCGNHCPGVRILEARPVDALSRILREMALSPLGPQPAYLV